MDVNRHETLILFALGLLSGLALALPLALFPYRVVEPLVRGGLVVCAVTGALLAAQWLWERRR